MVTRFALFRRRWSRRSASEHEARRPMSKTLARCRKSMPNRFAVGAFAVGAGSAAQDGVRDAGIASASANAHGQFGARLLAHSDPASERALQRPVHDPCSGAIHRADATNARRHRATARRHRLPQCANPPRRSRPGSRSAQRSAVLSTDDGAPASVQLPHCDSWRRSTTWDGLATRVESRRMSASCLASGRVGSAAANRNHEGWVAKAPLAPGASSLERAAKQARTRITAVDATSRALTGISSRDRGARAQTVGNHVRHLARRDGVPSSACRSSGATDGLTNFQERQVCPR
jgi:hypothetical protein